MAGLDASLHTRTSIFIDLNAPQTQVREIAWEDFHRRYAPIIGGFARKLGARSAVEDVVQEVLVGFFTHAPEFVYDRSKGRFRGYLKKCTLAAIQKLRKNPETHADIDHLDAQAPAVDSAWNDVWEEELLRQAIGEAQREFSADHTYRAFELYVIMEMPVQEVAAQLGITHDVVYQAKTRVRKAIGAKLKALSAEYGG
jgi:RNA polymerase sigma factor (sigma-70 family)